MISAAPSARSGIQPAGNTDGGGSDPSDPTTMTAAPTTAAPTTAAPTTAASTPPPPAVPPLSGTYAVSITLTAVSGTVFDPTVGGVQDVVWTVVSACPSGPCDMTVQSSTGRTFALVYADGGWSYTDRPSTVECVDGVTGEPIGTTAPSSIDAALDPVTPLDPLATEPVGALAGELFETVPAPGFGGGEASYTSTITMTRTGD